MMVVITKLVKILYWLFTGKIKKEEKINHDDIRVMDFLGLYHLRNGKAGVLSGGQRNYWNLKTRMGDKDSALDEVALSK